MNNQHQKPRRLNFYSGPGTGKSTIAANTFAFLKMLGANVELVTEYAKDATWERRGSKVFEAQEYLFGKQNFRLFRLHDEVDFVITDSPILMSEVYTPENYAMPSLRQVIHEAHAVADNLDIFLVRNKPYNPIGRNQNEDEARVLDVKIRDLLDNESPGYLVMEYGREVVDKVTAKLIELEWIPNLKDTQFLELVKYHHSMAKYYQEMWVRNNNKNLSLDAEQDD